MAKSSKNPMSLNITKLRELAAPETSAPAGGMGGAGGCVGTGPVVSA